MNQYVTGTVIRQLREKNKLTQADLANRLNITDKTVSKWETGKGYPDITLLEPIANVFDVSVTELLSGNAISNRNISANMLRSKLYICPVCGNVIHSMGEAVINCHGIQLSPSEAEDARLESNHNITIDVIEDEYYVVINHDMSKEHYISFIGAVSTDRFDMVKLYPEGGADARFRIRGINRIYYYCNRDGLYYYDIKHQSKR